MGRGPDGLGRTDTAVLQRAALALLAGLGALGLLWYRRRRLRRR